MVNWLKSISQVSQTSKYYIVAILNVTAYDFYMNFALVFKIINYSMLNQNTCLW